MPWGGEVIGHAILLSSPLAACYAARLLSRLVRELEESTSSNGSTLQRRHPANAHGTICDAGEPKQSLASSGQDCLQYSNAAFCHQGVGECSIDTPDCDEEDLDFCIITPQQALGALGVHAPHFTKIFLNGLTFVEDSSEPGTVLSVDECAYRMQSVITRPRSTDSLLDCSSPCLSPTTEFRLDECASCNTDCGTSISHMSCHSVSSSTTLFSSPDHASSHRSSFDVVYSLSSLYGERPLQEETIEESYDTTSQMDCSSPPALDVPFLDVPSLDYAPTCRSRVEAPASGSGQGGGAISTPFGLAAALQLACDSQRSGNVYTNSTHLHLADKARAAVCHGTSKLHYASSAREVASIESRLSFTRQRRPAAAGADPHVGSSWLASAKPSKRRWLPSSARAAPPPLPPPGSRSGATSSSSLTRAASRSQKCLLIPECWESTSVPQSSSQPPHPRSCAAASAVAALAAASAGLCKAPALPLPDGSTLESCVPPALRYYLAQARAAGVQGTQLGAADSAPASAGSEGGVGAAGDAGYLEGHCDDAECAAGRPGFVRAAVEHLNTQRLVCCHVTPFAAGKTSRKPRPLTQRGVQ